MADITIHICNRESPKLDPKLAIESVISDDFGAINLFIGTVRNSNEGQCVTGMSYDVYDKLALSLLQDIAEEAAAQSTDTCRIYIAHAKGRLSLKDTSVVIAVASPHRDASFSLSRFIIEELKLRAPIWKQEHYQNGDSEWLKLG